MGIFVALEGIDGAGKSLQSGMLANHFALANFKVKTMRTPGGSPFGNAIRALVVDGDNPIAPMTQALLFTAARYELGSEASEAMRTGTHLVICDRWSDSTIAYQSREIDLATLERLNAMIRPEPDLTVLLDVPVEVALERLSIRPNQDRGVTNNRYERPEVLEHARKMYRQYLGERNSPKVLAIDGRQPAEAIAEVIREAVNGLLARDVM